MPPRNLPTLLLAACVAHTLPGAAFPVALGQDGSASRPATQPSLNAPTPNVYAARTVARLARLDLRLTDSPTAADYALAAALLGAAHSLDPTNETILRNRLEAARAAGDEQQVLESTRELVSLNPRDEQAVLRLIAARVSQGQTADERLGLLDRFVANEKTLPRSIRSRLALDAAMLARESGDEAGFADRLAKAVEIDSTHKEAAVVAASYYADRVDDPVGRLETLLNVLLADPIDPNLHRRVASELADGGAFSAARRFTRNAAALTSRTVDGVPDDLIRQGLMLEWRVSGPAGVVAELNRQSAELRAQTERTAILNRQTFDPTSPVLTLPYERMRALASLGAGDEPTLDDALNQIERILGAVSREAELLDPASEQADAYSLARETARLELVVLRLWSGRQYDRVADDAERLLTQTHPKLAESDSMVALVPLLKLRTGEPQAAIDELEPKADQAAALRVVLALAYEAVGRETDSVRMLRRLASEATLTEASAWASDRLNQANRSAGLFPLTARLETAASVGSWLDTMCADPRRFIAIEVTTQSQTVHPLSPAPLVIRMRNHAPIAISAGPGKVLNTSFLLTPKLDSGSEFVAAASVPEFVDATTRFRLEPGEVIEFHVDPELGFAGLAVETYSIQTSRLRWSLIQGPRTTQDGRWEPGAMCIATDARQLTRPAMPECRLLNPMTPEGLSELRQRLASSPESVFPVLIGTVRAWLPGTMPMSTSPLGVDTVAAIAGAFAARFPGLPPNMRAAVLAALPPDALAPGMAALDAAAATDTDPVVCLTYLLTRVSRADDPALVQMLSSPDPLVAESARTIQARLAEGRSGYARRVSSGAPR